MNETKTKVYRTDEYGKFKFLVGNREIRETQVKKIIASINKVGYVLSPLTLNEKMEIIDGQGRFCALRELGMPIDYVIEPGAGVEHCRAMNLNSKSNWTTEDFIHSYAAEGLLSYKWLETLLRAYKSVPISIICKALSNEVTPRVDTGALRRGEFMCGQEDYDKATRRLDFVSEFIDFAAQKIDGKKDYFLTAVLFAYEHPDVDNDKLLMKLKKNYRKMPAIANLEDALNGVSDCYNFQSRQRTVYLLNDYLRMSDRKRSPEYWNPRRSDTRGDLWG